MAVTQNWNVVAVEPVALASGSVGLNVLTAATVADGQTAIDVNLAADSILVGGPSAQSIALSPPGSSSTLVYNSGASAGSRVEWQTGLPVSQLSLTFTGVSNKTFTATSNQSYFFSGRAVNVSDANDWWFGQISVYFDGADVHSVVTGYVGSQTIQPVISNSGTLVVLQFVGGPGPSPVNVNGTLKYQTI